jgi:hypothetical protein
VSDEARRAYAPPSDGFEGCVFPLKSEFEGQQFSERLAHFDL